MLSWPVLSIGALFVPSLPISATGVVTFVPLSELSSPSECVTSVHCLPFGAKKIYILGAEVFCWISSNTCFNWRLFRLVLFNVKILLICCCHNCRNYQRLLSIHWKSQEWTKLLKCWGQKKKKKREDGMEQEKRKFAVRNFKALRLSLSFNGRVV